MSKIIEIEITQDAIDELNKIKKKLGLPATKLRAGKKLKALFG